MESQTPAKRRRLNDALHKPFKSPLRLPPKTKAEGPIASPLSSNPSYPTNPSTQTTPNASKLPNDTATPTKPKIQPTPIKTPLSSPSTTTPSAILLAIQSTSKEIRQLESCAISARMEIETLTQALSILQSSKCVELDGLIEKWRGAARLAAEEVFAGARDKVNRMGGVGAWRERESEKKGFGDVWEKDVEVKNLDPDTDDEEDGEEGGDGEEEGKLARERERELYESDSRIPVVEDDWDYDRRSREKESEKDKEKVSDGVGDDYDSFTMDMMLKTLNIELSLIGYDKHRQMWVG